MNSNTSIRQSVKNIQDSPWRERIRSQFHQRIRDARSLHVERQRSSSMSSMGDDVFSNGHDNPFGSLVKNELSSLRQQDDWLFNLSPEEATELERQLYMEAVEQDIGLPQDMNAMYIDDDMYLNELVEEQLKNTVPKHICFLCNHGTIEQMTETSLKCSHCCFQIIRPSSITPELFKSEMQHLSQMHGMNCHFQLIPMYTLQTGLVIMCSKCDYSAGL